MKLPFTICDCGWRIEKKPSAAAVSNPHSALRTPHSRRGIALVITLIMLSVTLVMALAFLALARRERGSVTTTTDVTTARLAADSAVANAEAQIAANILSSLTNGGYPGTYNLRLLVSTNYINPAGFDPASSNPTNVNYDFKINNGGVLNGNDLIQNIANLWILPRAPVMNTIDTNDPAGRFYLDLNRNGMFDPNGWVTNVDANNNVLLDANNNPVVTLQAGDPEWIGVLEHPDQPHGPNNQFIARYAFLAQPIGNSLDINYIHNQAVTKAVNPTPNSSVSDGYFRNQGVGSWELNLAAFLADLNTNTWSPAPLPANVYYAYNEPLNYNNNVGIAFDDARALLSYRYNFNYNNQVSADTFFNNNAANAFPFDGIDGYSDGPLQLTLNTNADQPSLTAGGDWKTSQPWPGANNTNRFFSLEDYLDPTKVGVNFTNRLGLAGSSTDTYSRYTFYRMLDQLGTDSTTDTGKLNLNYSNAVVSYAVINGVSLATNITVVVGAETNLMPWRPLDFFTAAADKLLRTYSANWIGSTPQSYQTFTNAYAVTAPFGITNIPVWVSNRFVYTPAVNRLLQFAANLYDASTNGNFNLPHVFRPVFEKNLNNDIFIVGYVPVNSVNGSDLQSDPQLAPPYDFPQLSAVPANKPILGSAGVPINVYGVPWIIGAKKGLPGFNQFYLTNTVQVTRKLQFSRKSVGQRSATDPFTTNQMYVFSFNTGLGVSFWNPYNNYYGYPNAPRPLTVFGQDVISAALTSSNGAAWYFATNFYVGSASGYSVPAWPGSQWSGNAPSALPNPNSFLMANWAFNFLPQSVYRFLQYGGPGFDPYNSLTFSQWETTALLQQLPQFAMSVTNYLQAYILDGNNVIDYVQLRDPTTTANLNAALADPNYPQPDNILYQWSTNAYQNSSGAPACGVINQIVVSQNSTNTPKAGGQWSTATTVIPGDITPPAEAAYFRGFFTPGGVFVYNNKQYNNLELTNQAPYTPSRTILSAFLLQANDPLVHYLASDLNSQNGANAAWGNGISWQNGVWKHVDDMANSTFPTAAPATPIGGRYQPWGQSRQMAAILNVDTNAYNLAYKDPLTWGPDDWDFPTNLYPTVGWIGRVHRGTPWQTVDLKITNILAYYANQGSSSQNIGSNTWANWTGDLLTDYNTTQFFDAANSAPTQDRLLFDLFTTRFNDNAVRGTLPINQTHLAAWSALFSGMVVLSNSTSSQALSQGTPPSYQATNISPAGVDTANSPLWQIVNGPLGINATRANTNLFPQQSFTHLGDILQVPALTERSPFLNWYDPNNIQQMSGISDELYEWLPQQMMGLVRLGAPRYVVYCYGQALRPAPGGQVLSGPYFKMVTNYQVVAEHAVRAVIRVDNANTPQPHAVVESYNVLGPN